MIKFNYDPLFGLVNWVFRAPANGSSKYPKKRVTRKKIAVARVPLIKRIFNPTRGRLKPRHERYD